MKFLAGDFIRGASKPLREAIRGDDAFQKFGTAITTGAENFFKKGTAEWEKYKAEEEKIRDRINLLRSQYGVVNKEVAVAVSGMPDDDFNNLLQNFRSAQSSSRKTLAFRDFINAQDVPTEDIPIGEMAPHPSALDKRVIEDLTADTIDSSVRRVVGTVTPGTLSDKQTKTFMGHLGDEFARRGFGDPARRSDLIRIEALQEAMTQRPAGVSEEEWLGFMEGKIRERDPSDVTFRVPFSRKAELERMTGELTFENLQLTNQKLQREATTEQERQDKLDKTLVELGYDINSPALVQIAKGIGVKLTKKTIWREIDSQLTGITPMVQTFKMLQEANAEGRIKITNAQYNAHLNNTRRKFVAFMGPDISIDIAGNPTWDPENLHLAHKVNALNKLTNDHGRKWIDAHEAGYDSAKAISIADKFINANIPAYIIDQMNILRKADRDQKGWEQLIEEQPDKASRIALAETIGNQLTDKSGPTGQYVNSPGISAVLTPFTANKLKQYLLNFAKDPEKNRKTILSDVGADTVTTPVVAAGTVTTPVVATGKEPPVVTGVKWEEGRKPFDVATALKNMFVGKSNPGEKDIYGVLNKFEFSQEEKNIIFTAVENSDRRDEIMKNPDKSQSILIKILTGLDKTGSNVSQGAGDSFKLSSDQEIGEPPIEREGLMSRQVLSPAMNKKLKSLGIKLTRRDQPEKTKTRVSATTEEKIADITDQAADAFTNIKEKHGDISRMNEFTLMRHIKAEVSAIARKKAYYIPNMGERKAAIEEITKNIYNAYISR